MLLLEARYPALMDNFRALHASLSSGSNVIRAGNKHRTMYFEPKPWIKRFRELQDLQESGRTFARGWSEIDIVSNRQFSNKSLLVCNLDQR